MSKIYVVDTNVLINDPQAVLKFGENDVIIPLTVLEELDKQKSSDRDISRDARAAVRQLTSLVAGDVDAIGEGVELENGGRLFIRPNVLEKQESITPTCNDDHILNLTFHHQLHSGKEVVLVTNDLCMTMKAKGIGIKYAEEFRSEIVIEDPDLLPKGFVDIPDKWLESLDKEDVIAKSNGLTHIRAEKVREVIGEESFGINDWLVNEEDLIAARFDDVTEDEEFFIFTFVNVEAQLNARKAAGISGRDIYQGIALDSLLDTDIDIVVLDGAAGSGKTLLAMAAASEMIRGKRKSYRMEQLIFTRTNDTQFKEIGFLKGGEAEKMAPWLAGCTDNMEVIARASKKPQFLPANAVDMSGDNEEAFIKFKSMNFMRGRSINHKILVIDEAQNMTVEQVKTMITRAGEYCKVIMLGNLAQIDNDYVSPRTSGLTYATEKLHGVPFAKVMCLQGVKRSRLSEFAEENF